MNAGKIGRGVGKLVVSCMERKEQPKKKEQKSLAETLFGQVGAYYLGRKK